MDTPVKKINGEEIRVIAFNFIKQLNGLPLDQAQMILNVIKQILLASHIVDISDERFKKAIEASNFDSEIKISASLDETDIFIKSHR